MEDGLDSGELKESDWFEIFKTGTWRGRPYTTSDLDKMVENFQKGDPEPALFIGHNAPGDTMKEAEGWVSALKRKGNKLMAKARNVSGYLRYAVNDERYPMRSVEIWPNYCGRGMALGGIAFLGAANPEVGGMARFKFSKGDDGEFPIFAEERGGKLCFSYLSTEKMASGNGSQDIVQHKKSEEKSMTEAEIQKLIADGIAAGLANAQAQFSSSPEFMTMQAANVQLAADLEASRNHAAAVAVKADLDNCLAFAKKLVDDKKVTPAQFNGGLAGFLASLDNSDKVEFSKDKPQTRREFAMDLLSNQPGKGSLFSQVDGDAARAGEDDNISADVVAFAAKNGWDPKIVAQQFASQRRGLSGAVAASADEEGAGVSGVSVSIGAVAAKA